MQGVRNWPPDETWDRERTIARNETGATMTGQCGHAILRAAEYVWDGETESAYCSPECAERAAARFLLDGLGVADLAELHRLVRVARAYETTIMEADTMSAKTKVTVGGGGIRTTSNTRGPEAPTRTFVLPIDVHEVESTINCGFRAVWGTVDVDGDELVVCSGAGFGSTWATIDFRGKQYAIGAHELVAAFLDAIQAA